MLASLAALITLQSIDSAADGARRRLADMPKALAEVDARIAAAAAGVEAAKAAFQECVTARRALEKDVAALDTRLARFEEHKAAVKTNEQFAALNSEIATAKAEKDALEEKILLQLEDADRLTENVKAADTMLAAAKREGDAERAKMSAEKQTVEAELARLEGERAAARKGVEPRPLALYDQLLKGRRGIAVAQMTGEICMACHVRLRPPVTQVVRRNDEIVQCESCQRILYHQAPAPEAAAGQAS